MKQFKRAKIYLRRNYKIALLSSLMIFIIANLIFIIINIYNINLKSEKTTIDNVDYYTIVDSEMTTNKTYEYTLKIHEQVHKIIEEVSKFENDPRVIDVDYHVMVNAFSEDYLLAKQKRDDKNLNTQVFYGVSEDDYDQFDIKSLKDNEIIVPKGYKKENDELVSIGDELTYIMPVFNEESLFYNIPSKEGVILEKTFKLKVVDIYEEELNEEIDQPILIKNQSVLSYYDSMYKSFVDNYTKNNFSNILEYNDGVIYNAKVLRPTVFAKDFYSLKEINSEMIRMNYKLKIYKEYSVDNEVERDYDLKSSIDDSMKILNSISRYSTVINAMLIGVIVVIVIAIYFILDIFLKERKREFAIYQSLGEKTSSIQKQYFIEQTLCMIPSFILSILVSNILSRWLIGIIKQANINSQKEIYIANNKYNELLEVQAMIDEIYELNINYLSILITLIILVIVVFVLTYFGFKKFKKMRLNELLRYE